MRPTSTVDLNAAFYMCRIELKLCLIIYVCLNGNGNFVGGAVASWLVRSTPERAVQVRVLAGDIVLCS